MDTGWVKTAAAQVRTTIKQAINKIERVGSGNAERTPRPAPDDAPSPTNHPGDKAPGADNN